MSELNANGRLDVPSVQDRLIEAGERLFCQGGFNETSVRDIAAAAECNVASVNYYFGGKDNLYVEIWRRRLSLMRDSRLASIEVVMSGPQPVSLELLLASYAGAFLGPITEGGPACRFVSLMAREMMEPHLPPKMFLDEMVLPVMRVFGKALQTICPWLDEVQTRQSILSIVGQLVQTVAAREMFERGGHPVEFQLDVKEMVGHIVMFSAAGIRAYQGATGECR